MLNTRNSFIREVIVDRCLSGKRAMSATEIMAEVQKFLDLNQETKGSSRNTILRDIHSIRDRWNVEISEDKIGKVIYYKYKDPMFSIYRSTLTVVELEKLLHLIQILKSYVGLPQFEWVEELGARIYASAYENSESKPIVSISHNPEYAKFLKHFNPLFDYIKSKTAIELTYRKFNSDIVTTRTVHPYHLKEYQNRWYLVGWCENHPDHLSCFGFERIIDFSKSKEEFVENPGFDVEDYFNSMLGLTIPDGSVPQDVLLWVENRDYPYVQSNPIHHSQKYVKDADGGKIISLHLYINYELEMRIMSYGARMKVLAPEELQRKMKERCQEMAELYDVSITNDEPKGYYIL